jgi:hypothetical protein
MPKNIEYKCKNLYFLFSISFLYFSIFFSRSLLLYLFAHLHLIHSHKPSAQCPPFAGCRSCAPALGCPRPVQACHRSPLSGCDSHPLLSVSVGRVASSRRRCLRPLLPALLLPPPLLLPAPSGHSACATGTSEAAPAARSPNAPKRKILPQLLRASVRCPPASVAWPNFAELSHLPSQEVRPSLAPAPSQPPPLPSNVGR